MMFKKQTKRSRINLKKVTYIFKFINSQVILFLLILLGYVAYKKKIITSEGREDFTNLLIMIIMPCNIFVSFIADINKEVLTQSLYVLISSLLIQIFSIFLSRILYNNMNYSKGVILKYGTICSNSGFIGLPVVESVYGDVGMVYGSVFMLPFRICMWTIGLSLFTKTDNKHVIKKALTHPCIISVFLGLLVAIANITIPIPIKSALKYTGDCTTPLSMILIGSILAQNKDRINIDKNVILYCFIRLLFIPFTILVILKLLGVSQEVIGVCVLMSGMPAAGITAVLAEKHGYNTGFAAQIIFISTVISLFTLTMFSIII